MPSCRAPALPRERGRRLVHLTLHADYSLRVLLYLAAHPDAPRLHAGGERGLRHLQEPPGARGADAGAARLRRGAPRALGRHRSWRGALGRFPWARCSGAEPDFHLAECFDREQNTCPIAPACGLKGVLYEAREAFLGGAGQVHAGGPGEALAQGPGGLFLPTPSAREGLTALDMDSAPARALPPHRRPALGGGAALCRGPCAGGPGALPQPRLPGGGGGLPPAWVGRRRPPCGMGHTCTREQRPWSHACRRW